MSKIAFVYGDKELDPFMEEMTFRGHNSGIYRTAGEALKDLTQRERYSMIVMELNLPAGGGWRDPFARKALPKGFSRTREVGLSLIEVLRDHHSINNTTAIVVMSSYAPEKDPQFPEAKKRCLDLGATEYFDHRTTTSSAVCDRLEELMRRS